MLYSLVRSRIHLALIRAMKLNRDMSFMLKPAEARMIEEIAKEATKDIFNYFTEAKEKGVI